MAEFVGGLLCGGLAHALPRMEWTRVRAHANGCQHLPVGQPGGRPVASIPDLRVVPPRGGELCQQLAHRRHLGQPHVFALAALCRRHALRADASQRRAPSRRRGKRTGCAGFPVLLRTWTPRILVGRGERRQAPPSLRRLTFPFGRRVNDPFLARSGPSDCRARYRTENSQRYLPPHERGLPSARGAARPRAPSRVQDASPTTRGRPATSARGRIPGRQPSSPAQAPPARGGGDQAPRPGPCPRRSQYLGGLASSPSRPGRRAPCQPGHACAQAT